MSEAKAKASHSFFKIFLDEDCRAKTMRIPPTFKKKMKRKKSGVVYLSGRGEDEIWKVELIKGEKGGLYFGGKGWTEFVTHHSICSADFLIFKFDGQETFKVTIFGPHGCEKHANRLNETKAEAEVIDLPPVAASSSAFPTFIATMKPYNISPAKFVDIPRPFVKCYLEKVEKKAMFVLCCQRKEWPVYIKLRTGDHIKGCLSTGWKVFVRENQLKVGDICKFELQEPFRFHVTISRTNA